MRDGKVWGLEDAASWLGASPWSGDVLRHLQAAEAERREQWLWLVVAMRAALERCGLDATRVVVIERSEPPDPAGIGALAADLDE